MANILLEIARPIEDGTTLSFRAPCACNAVTGLSVTYPAVTDTQISQATKVFTFRDTHGNTLTGLGNLFLDGALVQVMLDVTNSAAFIMNADTSGYLEQKLASVSTVNSQLATGALTLTAGLQYGDELPTPGITGRIFFKKV